MNFLAVVAGFKGVVRVVAGCCGCHALFHLVSHSYDYHPNYRVGSAGDADDFSQKIRDQTETSP